MRLQPSTWSAVLPFLIACGGAASHAAPADAGLIVIAPVDASHDVAPKDTGRDAPFDPAACVSADASTALPCGTLAFDVSPVASRARNHHVTLIADTLSGPMLYAIGGAESEAAIAFVDRIPINADGSLGEWVSEPPLPTGTGGLVGDLVSGVIVVAGGTTASGTTDAAYSAVVETDGSLGPWKPAGSVGEGRMHAGSFSIGSTMWILGGFDNQSVWSDIVSATVSPDGTVSTWGAAGQLPGPRSHFSLTLLGSYVYITGGLSASAYNDPPDLADAWRGQVESDGTVDQWTQLTTLPVAEATHASFFYGGYLHVCGGINNVPAQDDRCWRAPVLADHTLGTWEDVSPLPLARGHVHQMPILGDKVYSIAGAIDFNLDSTTQIDIGVFSTSPSKMSIAPRAPRPVVHPSPPRHGSMCHLASHAS